MTSGLALARKLGVASAWPCLLVAFMFKCRALTAWVATSVGHPPCSACVGGSDPVLHQSCQGVCLSDGAAVFLYYVSRARGCLACEEVRWFISNAPSDWLLHVYDGLVAKV